MVEMSRPVYWQPDDQMVAHWTLLSPVADDNHLSSCIGCWQGLSVFNSGHTAVQDLKTYLRARALCI